MSLGAGIEWQERGILPVEDGLVLGEDLSVEGEHLFLLEIVIEIASHEGEGAAAPRPDGLGGVEQTQPSPARESHRQPRREGQHYLEASRP